ncbi:hypothetical protein M885DRAFT_513048 [Pelagophyceae sp. CCMP2097]|nr:hypothetical protein M885DRAFT_513048 [Pelagophyceae sp. CCMP2097]
MSSLRSCRRCRIRKTSARSNLACAPAAAQTTTQPSSPRSAACRRSSAAGATPTGTAQTATTRSRRRPRRRRLRQSRSRRTTSGTPSPTPTTRTATAPTRARSRQRRRRSRRPGRRCTGQCPSSSGTCSATKARAGSTAQAEPGGRLPNAMPASLVTMGLEKALVSTR